MDVAMATIFWLSIHWRHLANTTEQCVCCGDAALCQITLTTCLVSGKDLIKYLIPC